MPERERFFHTANVFYRNAELLAKRTKQLNYLLLFAL